MVIALGAGSWVSGFSVVLAMITGTDNIYSLPEYSGGGESKTFFHAFAHFFIAPFVVGLIVTGVRKHQGRKRSGVSWRSSAAGPAS
jgi:hypothetical protein